MDQKIINILKFYEDIGIHLHFNQSQNQTKTGSSEFLKRSSEKKLENFNINKPKQVDKFLNKADVIDDLENLFKNFNGCNLKKTATNFVKFQGNKNANLLFIDGTPDTQEDKVGKSFVSSKGDLFKKMINSIQLKMEHIFIANAIPWRPPGNRYPTLDEIKTCRPFIFNLINLLKPKIIVCLGEVSTNQILDLKQSFIKARGKWHFLKSDPSNNFGSEYKPYVLPTLSISYLLTRPDMKRQAWEDMKLLRDKFREVCTVDY